MGILLKFCDNFKSLKEYVQYEKAILLSDPKGVLELLEVMLTYMSTLEDRLKSVEGLSKEVDNRTKGSIVGGCVNK